jgi:hypothetical protein
MLLAGTVKPRFKAPRFNANPDLTRLIPFPQNFGRFFEDVRQNFQRFLSYFLCFKAYAR